MDIHAQRGAKVKFIGTSDAQVNWGGCDDPRAVLKEGETYAVESTEVHSWHTKVSLIGVDGKFPSAAFEDAK